jgi:hypothetical protein
VQCHCSLLLTIMSVLPRELALSIERILDGGAGSQPDTFGSLSRDFDPVDLLNEFFPDGPSVHVEDV